MIKVNIEMADILRGQICVNRGRIEKKLQGCCVKR